jgi:type III protein arginine methyltransferase
MFARAIEIAPEFHEARFNLAKSLKDQGQNSKAELEYRQYLLRRPEDPDAIYNLANIVALGDRLGEAADLFRNVVRIAPQFHEAKANLALIEDQRGNSTEALHLLEQVLALAPDHAHANHLRRSILSRMVPRWHFAMLNDQERNDSYEKAISAAVSGKHVLEIGAGSGLLAMMAARHGARTVVACEMSEQLAAAARKIVASNNFADRISVVAKKSMQLEVGVDLQQKADVLIAEVFDAGLLGEGFVSALVHARAELLVETPKVIPAGATVYGVLVECRELRTIHPIGRVSGFDLSDFNVFQTIGYEPIDMRAISHESLTQPFVVSELDFTTVGLEMAETILKPTVIKDGVCHAIVFWFELDLGAGSVLSSYPDKPTSHWKQAVQFFGSDKPLHAGDAVALKATRTPNGYSFELVDGAKIALMGAPAPIEGST